MARSAIVLDSNLNTRGALLAISELNVSTMKRTPQKELTIVAIGLLIVAAAILGSVAYLLRLMARFIASRGRSRS
jgi:hypothetical protein